MRLIRSFPAEVPAGRNYVVDDAERLVNTGYSYRGLVGMGDVVHLDWDQAVSRRDLVRFVERVRLAPDRVLVAPTMIEEESRRGLGSAVWNCLAYEADGQRTRFVREGEPTCDLFGFGMVYLPGKLVDAFEQRWRVDLDAGRVRFNDLSFAGWHYREVGPAEIAWDVNCVHLHYKIGEVIR
jgi:hypothetical protein